VTYKEAVSVLLDVEPELADNAAEVARRVGCAYSTARHYTKRWKQSRTVDWIMPRATDTRPCKRCEFVSICRPLALEGLPILCERICQRDLDWAKADGLLSELLLSRAEADDVRRYG